jgi:hypothetical protein
VAAAELLETAGLIGLGDKASEEALFIGEAL